MLAMERKIINQSSAARIRGVSRQRISELYAKGRFTIPVNDEGAEVKGAVYLDEIETMTEGKRGRPALTEAQRVERGLDEYHVNDWVEWIHKPRDGYGFEVPISARIDKVGASRLLLVFKDGEGVEQAAWVNKKHTVITLKQV